MDGGFYVVDYLLWIQPVGFTLVHLNTPDLRHGSVAPSSSSAGRIGVALTNNKGDLTRVKNQLANNKKTWGLDKS